MAKRHSNSATSFAAVRQIPVALYLRMSSDKQECSIDDQRKALTEYCRQHGYRIVREYLDEGISGWKGKERLGFQQLIADAPKREFQAVLCWDQSRFSRFDPMEANYFWHILRREEVRIETMKEGRLDLDSLGGWLTASITQHGKAEYVKSMAVDIARGQRGKRAEGYWLNLAPFGYRKPPGKNQRLILGPPEEVAAIQLMFKLRAQGYGHSAIAKVLNEQACVKPPFAEFWAKPCVRSTLRRVTYTGDSLTGASSRPRFAGKAETKLVKDTHPAIIDKATWEAVRQLDGVTRKREGQGEGSPLAGLLYCSHCGKMLYDDKRRNVYICGSFQAYGKCSSNRIDRGHMLAVLAAKIRGDVLGGSLEALTQRIEKYRAKQRTETPAIDLGDVRRQIAAIDAKLATAAERLMMITPSLVKTIEAKMVDLQRQREGLEAKLDAPAPERKARRPAKEVAADLWQLDEVLRKGSPRDVRTALSKIVKRIDLKFEPISTAGKRVSMAPAGALIQFPKEAAQSR
ncbi:MAG: recombinase family protein [Pirellulaceae bacterium]